ncbi:hypothetical protein AB0F72_15150 [Actinoplanes sp. NPDC023936]|uniref:hypothetical protein n=1 Tax=Actinoplanes sp. NPDC023936 TaxID=3154910 RepID=UPI0033C792C2
MKQKNIRPRVRAGSLPPITLGVAALMATLDVALMCFSVVLLGLSQTVLAAFTGIASVGLANKLARRLLR